MVTYVLDASAVLRFLDGEPGVNRVKEIFRLALHGDCKIVISAVNWGEVFGKLHKRHGPHIATNRTRRLLRKGLQVVPATALRAAGAAILKVELGVPYADAFGVELARDSAEHVLVTADFDAKPAVGRVEIEFLPPKSTP